MANDSLGGTRVALLEARMESELASLVRRHGGEPVCVPAMREVERNCDVEATLAVDAVARGGALVVLATGVGLQRWLNVATTLGRGVELREGLLRATVVCRGPKPVAVLKREGLPAQVRAPAPHTSKELLEVLDSLDVAARDTVFVHDGGANRTVPESLVGRGAQVVELQPYEWALPEDDGALRALIASLIAGELGAIAVTTQIQARNLFSLADSMGVRAALCDALRKRVIVAAVGPTCERALQELGVPPHVVPEVSKMGPLVMALASHLASAASLRSAPDRQSH